MYIYISKRQFYLEGYDQNKKGQFFNRNKAIALKKLFSVQQQQSLNNDAVFTQIQIQITYYHHML